jgi:hypothetical protein
LSADNERIRARVPPIITDIPAEEEAADRDPGEPEIIAEDEAELRELMSSFAFEEEDVKEELAELCDWISEIAQSDHWKLSERQKRMLGKPITLLLNSLWVKLADFIPRFFAAWCDRTPGLMASTMACSFVFGPKLWKQIQIQRSRRRHPGGAAPAPAERREANGQGPAGPVLVPDAPPAAAEGGARSGVNWD